MKRILPMLSIILLSACTTTGAPYSAAELPKLDKKSAQLVVYRHPAFFSDGNSPVLSINGEDTCKIAVNSFYSAAIPPGKTHLEATGLGMRQAIRTIDLRAGERRYVRLTLNGQHTGVSLIPFVGIANAVSASKSAEEDVQAFLFKDIPQEQAEAELLQTHETLDCK